jgi:hypothetical protein
MMSLLKAEPARLETFGDPCAVSFLQPSCIASPCAEHNHRGSIRESASWAA